MKSWMSRRVTPVVGAVIALLAFAPAAGAQSGKIVELDIAGDAVAGTTSTFTLTFTNPAGANTQVGSANVTTPFTLVSPAGSNNTVALRGMAIQPGKSLTVEITASVPCGYTGDGAWSVLAKQSNNFNGPPGNDVAVVGDLVTPVTGSCGLVFGTLPAAAEVGAAITGTPFSPSGPPVTVLVVDDSGEPVPGATVPITLSLAPGSAFGPLSGTTTRTTSGGVATFSGISIGSPGLYSLQASSPGFDPVFTPFFRVDSEVVQCVEDVPCTGTATTGRSELTLTGEPNANIDVGILRLSYGAGLAIDCAGYQEVTVGTAVFDVTGGRTKTAVLEIDKRDMQTVPNNGASFLQICFASPHAFPTRTGTAVVDGSFDWNGDGVPEPVYEGLLPDCGAPPCISKRQKNGQGDGVVTVLLPAGDPGMRG